MLGGSSTIHGDFDHSEEVTFSLQVSATQTANAWQICAGGFYTLTTPAQNYQDHPSTTNLAKSLKAKNQARVTTGVVKFERVRPHGRNIDTNELHLYYFILFFVSLWPHCHRGLRRLLWFFFTPMRRQDLARHGTSRSCEDNIRAVSAARCTPTVVRGLNTSAEWAAWILYTTF